MKKTIVGIVVTVVFILCMSLFGIPIMAQKGYMKAFEGERVRPHETDNFNY